MSGAIFISYRRDDSEGEAGRLYDDLVRTFGAPSVFMDVSDIHPGKDFRKAIDDNVAKSAVLLAIIGPGWTSIKDAAGARRLDQTNDFVRLEIASALTRGIDVVPVLVHGARMPAAADLPENLQDLAYRNGVELTHARWNSDVEVLVRALRDYVSTGAALPTRTIRRAIGGEPEPVEILAAPAHSPAASMISAAPERIAPKAEEETKNSKAWIRNVMSGIVLLAVCGTIVYQHWSQSQAASTPSASQPVSTAAASQASTAGTPAADQPPKDQPPKSVADHKPATRAASEAAPQRNALIGTWVATDWSTRGSLIAAGTPVEFQIEPAGALFNVRLFATTGTGMLSCGVQSVPITDDSLSLVMDEQASPSCGKYPGMYTANVRLRKIGERAYMLVSGRYPTLNMEFQRIQ